jgi:hypothetical protein
MEDYAIRAATLDDLDALTDIYNHYIINTAIDILPRGGWVVMLKAYLDRGARRQAEGIMCVA